MTVVCGSLIASWALNQSREACSPCVSTMLRGVAWTAIAMSLLLAGGYYYMLPLKERVPFLVMADAYTGTSTVARLADDFSATPGR